MPLNMDQDGLMKNRGKKCFNTVPLSNQGGGVL